MTDEGDATDNRALPDKPPQPSPPRGGGAPAGGGEGPHPPSSHCEERSDVAIRPPYLAKFYIICYDLSKRCSGGGWPLLSQGEAMLLKASSYPVARR